MYQIAQVYIPTKPNKMFASPLIFTGLGLTNIIA